MQDIENGYRHPKPLDPPPRPKTSSPPPPTSVVAPPPPPPPQKRQREEGRSNEEIRARLTQRLRPTLIESGALLLDESWVTKWMKRNGFHVHAKQTDRTCTDSEVRAGAKEFYEGLHQKDDPRMTCAHRLRSCA